MAFLELFDETLDINSTANYGLSLQIEPKKLTYCILDTIRNKYIMLRSYTDDEFEPRASKFLRHCFDEDDFLKRQFKGCKAVTVAEKTTLIPASLYDPAKKDDFFYLNHTNDPYETLLADQVSDPKAHLLYAVSKELLDAFHKYMPDVQPTCHIKPLLHQVLNDSKKVKGYYVHAHIESSFFNVMVMNHEILKFFNSFRYKNYLDIIYYILNIYKSLHIKNDEPLYLSGNIEQRGNLYKELSQYLEEILFSAPTGKASFCYAFIKVDLHQYVNLFNLSNCE